jgi:type IV pilus assembly protein PilY1
MNAHDSPWFRNTARAIVVCLIGSTLAQSAQAATILLADVPLQVQNTSKPNIMYTVDDSTSMANDFLPDYTVLADNAGNNNNQFCRDGNGAGPGANTAATTGLRCGSQGNSTTFASLSNLPPTLAAGFNRLYYNPLIVYMPPVGTNGTYYPSMTANNTGGPAAPWTKVYNNNWWLYATTVLPSSATVAAGNKSNLATGFSVSRWCNTEWPKGLVNPASSADPAWDNTDYCRITGYPYLSAAAPPASSGAPSVPMDYNYPFHDQSSATPDSASFNQTGTYMYCDATKMTKQNSCTPLAVSDGHCAAGQCDAIGSTCTGGYTPYVPSGCNTDPAYGSPSTCIGSECLVCSGHSCISSTATYTCSAPTTVNVTGCTTVISNALAGASVGLTYIADANDPTKGNVCRHAGIAYTTAPNPALSVSQFYGGVAPFTTKIGSCGSVPAKTVPRHYYKTTTLWCTAYTATTVYANLWKGYGTGTLPTQCQASKDVTHIYPKFIEYLGQYTGHDNNSTYPAFQRCDLDVAAGATATTCLHHLYWDTTTSSIQPMPLQTWDDATHSLVDQGVRDRTFAEEMTNYANWYAYYRTRILATKTVSSIAFNGLDDKVRVGYHTLFYPTTSPFQPSPQTFVDIKDFNPAQKTLWYTALLNNTTITTNPSKQTPTQDAMIRIGEYFKSGNGTVGSLVGATDPINLSCQRNYHILFTDGATNQPVTAYTTPGNVDNVVAAGGDLPRHQPYNNDPIYVYGTCYDSGAPCNATLPKAWPKPIVESSVMANTLADIALYYWKTDLRTTGSPSIYTNNVGSWSGDPAFHQHLNFSALSLGAAGTLPGDDQVATINAIIAGTTVWPAPSPPNKPVPAGPAIDDLWHATVNGFGHFVNANDPQDLQFGLGNILSEVANQPGSRSGAAFSSVNLAQPNSASIYLSSFAPHWGGSLIKATIDPLNATYVNAHVWDAQTALATQLTPGVAPHTTPWYDRRVVMTRDASNNPVSFEFGNLSAAQLLTLGANAGIQQRVVDYLRGSPAGEGQTRGKLRYRYGNFLGDIVNAQPAVVSATPIDPVTMVPVIPAFYETSNYGYTAFHNGLTTRLKRIYAAANDGMVHSFRDDIEVANGVNYPAGSEAWAYIPSMLIRSSTAYVAGLQSLTFQEGGNPPFAHHFMVDATPKQFPVDFANCGANNTTCTPNWRTILVGGLGKGGQGYYALDVTTPFNPHDVPTAGDKTAAGSRLLWEFTNGAPTSLRAGADGLPVTSLGYSYGRPLITKLRAFGWVAVFTSGYNNQTPDLPAGDGLNHLYVVDISNGKVLRTLTTPAGYGLAQVSGFVKDWHDQTTEQIYGGDLTGKFWRFDVHNPNPALWTVDLFATLDDGTTAQPVTSAPQIEVDLNNGIDRWVFIGTGKLLDPTDLASVQQQTLYAFRDGTVNQYETVGLPFTRAILGAGNEVTGLPGLGAIPTHGWYDDIGVGENIVVDVQADLNVVAYVGTKPGTDPCLTGQPATVYAREFTRGRSVLTDSGGNPQVSWTSMSGAVGIGILSLNTARGGTLDDPLLPPTLKGAVTQATDGQIVTFNLTLPALSGAHRMSWRIIGQ